jgi:hypothetical protein
MAKPTCGSQGESTDDVLKTFFWIAGIAGTTGTVLGKIWGAIGETSTVLGVAAPNLVWLSAVAGALITFGVVFSFYYNRCLRDPDTLAGCSAGVINGTVPGFDSTANALFPFTAMHDRVDVVVKSSYWHLIETNSLFVHCAGDADESPIVHCYYEDEAVCAAGLGSTIGAGLGALGGILLGALAGAAIGCATIILCVLAIIVAFIVAAAVVLAGAFLGGQTGRLVAEESDPTATTGEALAAGDYVTTKGDLTSLGDDDGARVYWFVDETTLHGRSSGSPEFSYRDPDANLNPDACPVIVE